jgi:integrase
MVRPRSVPSYRKHRQSRQALVTLTDGLGGRKDVLLGPHGTKESRVEYARVIAEWEAAGRTIPHRAAASDLTIHELILRFWLHVEKHYRRPDGSPTSEIDSYRMSFKPLKRLYGDALAKEFGPLSLKAVREAMVSGSWLTEAEKAKRQEEGHKLTWCRGLVNQRIGRIRRMFKWAVENEMIQAPVYQALMAVRGLVRGRSEARDTAPVKPVHPAWVEAVLPHLLPQVAAMVELQLTTGMRAGEVTIMRTIDIDTKGRIWLYKPTDHKTAWRGHHRVVPLGPRAQAILKPWLRLSVEEYLFQPKEALAWRWAKLREERKSKVQPSQQSRRKRKPQRTVSDHYTVTAYDHAVTSAIKKANAARACETCKPLDSADRCQACQANIIPHWHPHQLRHTKATEIRREAGLDAARAVLGHRSPVITEHYAELDVTKAAEVMERLG